MCTDLVIFFDIFQMTTFLETKGCKCIESERMILPPGFAHPTLLACDSIMTFGKLSSQKGRFYHHFIGIKN